MQKRGQDVIGQFRANCFVLSYYIQQAGYQQCFVSLGVSTGQMTRSFLLCWHVLNAAELIQQDTVVVSNAVVGGQELVMPFLAESSDVKIFQPLTFNTNQPFLPTCPPNPKVKQRETKKELPLLSIREHKQVRKLGLPLPKHGPRNLLGSPEAKMK